MDYLFIFIFCVDNDKGIELIMYFKKKFNNDKFQI